MVAPSEVPGFVPADRPSVAIASDGTLAAIADSSRVAVLEIPGAAPFAEIKIPSKVLATEIGWVGAPPRLVILSRYEAHSTVQLIDPYGPRTIAEIRLESPMKLLATVGTHALAVSSTTAAILTASDTAITPYQFPARAVPTAAGGAAGNFVVALGGSIEEWDPAARMPKRRLRLARPAVITGVGGSDRVVWLTTQQDPARLDVIPLVNRGQPKSHDLPELIAHAVGHPRSDLVVCVGAQTGKLFIVDTDGRAKLRTLTLDGIDRSEAAALVVGRVNGVLAAQSARPVVLAGIDAPAPVVPVVTEPVAEQPVEPRAVRKTVPPPPPSKTTLGDPAEIFGGGEVAPSEPRPARKTLPPPPPPSSKTTLGDPAQIFGGGEVGGSEPRPARKTTPPPPPPSSKTTLGEPAEIFGGGEVAPSEPRAARKSPLDDLLESFAAGEAAPESVKATPAARAETFGSIDVDVDDDVEEEAAPDEPLAERVTALPAITANAPAITAPSLALHAATPQPPSAVPAKASTSPAAAATPAAAAAPKTPALSTPTAMTSSPPAAAPPTSSSSPAAPTLQPAASAPHAAAAPRGATPPPSAASTSTLYSEPDDSPVISSRARSTTAQARPAPGASTSTLYGDPDESPVSSSRPRSTPAITSTLYGDPDDPPAVASRPRSTLYEPETAESAAARLSAWREKMRQAQARSEYVTPLPSVDRGPSWRDDVVLWTRGVFSSIERAVPAAPAIDHIAARFDLSPELVPALVLLYGAHLAGERGAAPVDVARVLGRRWDEALGSGQLAERGLAQYVDSRVRLVGPLRRALDEVGCTTGTLVGEPGAISLLGPCVVVDTGARLAFVASRCLSRVGGAILASHDDADPGELFIEARARGAAPMLRVAEGDIVELGTDPAILVVRDESIADELGVPRLFE